MALLSLPRRTRIARLSDRVPHPDLADLAELVDAAAEVGTKRRPIPRLARRRPRRRRTAGMVLLVAAVGAMVLAYRWWRAQERATAQLVEVTDRAASVPVASPPVPSPITQPAAEPAVESVADAVTPPGSQQHETTPSAVEPPPAGDAPVPHAGVSVSSELPAQGSSAGFTEPQAADPSHPTAREETSNASASTAWTPSIQPRRPQGAASSTPAHPRWGFGRGPSSGAPSMPAVRPAIPARPRPHLPR